MLGYNSEFFYKSINPIEGFGIRKLKLRPLADKF